MNKPPPPLWMKHIIQRSIAFLIHLYTATKNKTKFNKNISSFPYHTPYLTSYHIIYHIPYLSHIIQKQPLEVLCKKSVLTNFTKKRKKETPTQVFSCEFFLWNFKNTFFTEHFPVTASYYFSLWSLYASNFRLSSEVLF